MAVGEKEAVVLNEETEKESDVITYNYAGA